MTPLLESFLNKLPDEFPNTELVLSGARVEAKLKELSKRFPSLSYPKQVGLAILLQHVDLLRFTDAELLELSQLKFEYLESIIFPQLKQNRYFSPDEALYDTGSARIYELIDLEEVSTRTLQVKFAHFNLYEAETLKELILSLYNLGL